MGAGVARQCCEKQVTRPGRSQETRFPEIPGQESNPSFSTLVRLVAECSTRFGGEPGYGYQPHPARSG
jgi:hypothetical protein